PLLSETAPRRAYSRPSAISLRIHQMSRMRMMIGMGTPSSQSRIPLPIVRSFRVVDLSKALRLRQATPVRPHGAGVAAQRLASGGCGSRAEAACQRKRLQRGHGFDFLTDHATGLGLG